MGALCGVMGSLQAAEVIKEITGAGDTLSGSLLIFDGLRTDFRKIKMHPDPGCALCGPDATIKSLL
jgi:adenylyltransferase/sulfurtransferase